MATERPIGLPIRGSQNLACPFIAIQSQIILHKLAVQADPPVVVR